MAQTEKINLFDLELADALMQARRVRATEYLLLVAACEARTVLEILREVDAVLDDVQSDEFYFDTGYANNVGEQLGALSALGRLEAENSELTYRTTDLGLAYLREASDWLRKYLGETVYDGYIKKACECSVPAASATSRTGTLPRGRGAGV